MEISRAAFQKAAAFCGELGVMKSGMKGYESIWYMSKIPITSRPAPRKRELLSMFLVVYACHVITKIEKDRTKGKSSVEISKKSLTCGETLLYDSRK